MTNPKSENLDKIIAAISDSKAALFMGDFVYRNEPCGTTACLAGWANLVRFNEVGTGARKKRRYDDFGLAQDEFSDTNAASEFMGVEGNTHNLYYNGAPDYLNDEDRKQAAINLLTLFKTNPLAGWEDVIERDPHTSEYKLKQI